MNTPTEAHRALANKLCGPVFSWEKAQLIADSEALAVEVATREFSAVLDETRIERKSAQSRANKTESDLAAAKQEIMRQKYQVQDVKDSIGLLKEDLQALRCPIGLDELRDKCSAGTCLPCVRDRLAAAQSRAEKAERERDELRSALVAAQLDLVACGAVESVHRINTALAKSAPLPPCRDNIPPEMHERHVAESGDRRGTP